LPDVVTIVAQVCKALAKAHAAGIVHRDIKPDNVFLIDSDGDVFVKVLDFGIAKRAEDAALNMTSTGTMVGTPYYMSPEQVLSSKAVDFRCDLWALAVVAYNAITGTLPFVAETLGALCVAISNGSFTPPSRLRPGLPPALDHWFEKALHRDPEQRFGSAKQLAEALLRAAGDVRPVLGAVTGMHGPPTVDLARPAAAYTPAPYPASQPETLHGASLPTSAPRRRAALLVAAVGAAALLFGALATVLVVSSGTKPDASAEPVQASAPVVEPVAAPPAPSAPPQRGEAPPPVVEPSPKPAAVAQSPAPAPAPAAVRRPPTTAPKRTPVSKPPATSTATSKKEADRYGF
jgi:serine/threonine-protein kinase